MQPPEQGEAVEIDFAEAMAWFSLGLGFEMRQQPEQALQAFSEAVKRDPGNDTLVTITSERLIRAGRAEDAQLLVDSLVELEPDNPRALLWAARIRNTLGKSEEALPFLQRVIDLDPSTEAPYLQSAANLVRLQRQDEAVHMLEAALDAVENPMQSARLITQIQLQRLRSLPEAEQAAFRSALLEKVDDIRLRFPEEASFAFLSAGLRVQNGELEELFIPLQELDRAAGGSAELRAAILNQLARTVQPPGIIPLMLETRLKEEPDDALLLYLSGTLDEISDRPEAALLHFRRLVELYPEDLAAQRQRILLLAQLGRPARALGELQGLLEKYPEDIRFQLLAGHLYLLLGRPDDALARFEAVEKRTREGLELENPLYHLRGLANSQLQAGELSDAVDSLVDLMELEPAILEDVWRSHLASLFREDGQLDDAAVRQGEQRLAEALVDLSDRRPDAAIVELLLGRSLNYMQEHKKALEAFRRAEALAEDAGEGDQWLDARFDFDVANSLERSGEFDAAVERFEKIIRENPQHHQALNYLAYMWADKGIELDKALNYVERALELEPQNGSYLDTLAWVYFRQGNNEEALRLLESAAEIEPDQSEILLHLGQVTLHMKRFVEAAGYFRIGLVLDEGDFEEKLLQGLAEAEEGVAEMLKAPAAAE